MSSMVGETEENTTMEIFLAFRNNEKISVSDYRARFKSDPKHGDFDPAKDFEGEVIVDRERPAPLGPKKVIRIKVCPYPDPSQCSWKKGPTDGGDLICMAVEQTELIEEWMADPFTSRCKAHIPHKDQDPNHLIRRLL